MPYRGRGSLYPRFSSPFEPGDRVTILPGLGPDAVVKANDTFWGRNGANSGQPSRAVLGGGVAAMELGRGLMPSVAATVGDFSKSLNVPSGLGPPDIPGDLTPISTATGAQADELGDLINNRKPGDRFNVFPGSGPDAADASGAATADGDPRSLMSKVGGFFTRPGMAERLTNLGAGLAIEGDKPGGSFWTGLASGSKAAVEGEKQRQVAEQERQTILRREQSAERELLLRERRFRSAEDRLRAKDELEAAQREAEKEITSNLQEIYGNIDTEGLSPEASNALFITATQQAYNVAIINKEVGLAQVLEQRLARITPKDQQMKLTWSTAYDPDKNMKRVGIDPRTGISYVNEGGKITSINLDDWSTSAPNKETADQASAMERMNTRLGRSGGKAAASLIVDNQDLSLTGAIPPTIIEVGRILDGVVTQEDYQAFIRNPENIDHWKDPSVTASPEQRVALAKAIAAQIVGDPNGMSNQGFLTMTFMAGLRASDWVTDEAQKAYVNSLNFINPVVRFLSGAQMTNQEALRYYSALVAMPGEPVSVTSLKRERRAVLLNAMGLDATTGDALAADDPAIAQALSRMGMSPDDGPLQDMNTLGLPDDQRRIQGNRVRDIYLGGIERAIPIEAGLSYRIEDYDEPGPDYRNYSTSDPFGGV